jgi:S1-C subfamily serine protease
VQLKQGSTAAEAGLQPADIILEADQQPMCTVAVFIRITSQHATDSALLLLEHDGHDMYRMLKPY